MSGIGKKGFEALELGQKVEFDLMRAPAEKNAPLISGPLRSELGKKDQIKARRKLLHQSPPQGSQNQGGHDTQSYFHPS